MGKVERGGLLSHLLSIWQDLERVSVCAVGQPRVRSLFSHSLAFDLMYLMASSRVVVRTETELP